MSAGSDLCRLSLSELRVIIRVIFSLSLFLFFSLLNKSPLADSLSPREENRESVHCATIADEMIKIRERKVYARYYIILRWKTLQEIVEITRQRFRYCLSII